jgi:hypothetical protein
VVATGLRAAHHWAGRSSNQAEATMAEDRSGQNTDESIKRAAAESLGAGEDVRKRIHDLTLEALKSRSFDREGIRRVVRAVTEGMSVAAGGSRADMRHAFGEAFRGMDEALTKSVDAGHEALKQLVAAGRGISDNELKQALGGLKKIEEDFVSTVSQVADSANERARPELRELVRRATHAGTETGRQAAHLAAEFTLAGIELAGEFSARFAQAAGGVLAGMADALQKPEERDKKP